jgi:hypothetical protein
MEASPHSHCEPADWEEDPDAYGTPGKFRGERVLGHEGDRCESDLYGVGPSIAGSLRQLVGLRLGSNLWRLWRQLQRRRVLVLAFSVAS